MVLVVGATGLLGSEVCRQLRSAREPVRAMVRATSAPEKVDALRAAGAQTVVADLKDASSLERACTGAKAVITTASSTFSRQAGDSIETVDRSGYLSLIAAAERCGIERFIYTSIPPNLRFESPLVASKREIEAVLAKSVLQYTVLLANYFMEVWLSPALGLDAAGAKATVYGDGEQALAWVSYRDVAAFAIDSLHNPATLNSMLPVGGPENVTPNDVVAEFQRATHKKFEVKHVPEGEIRKQYEAATDPLDKSFAGLMLEYALGVPMDMGKTLRAVPRKLTSVREYAESAARTV